MTRVRRAFSVLAFVVLLASSVTAVPAWAQLSTAELNGRVTDSSGAVLPGATVTRRRPRPGLARTVVTDAPRFLSDLRICQPVRTGWRSRCKGSAATCRPASCCRSVRRRRSMPCSPLGRSRRRSRLKPPRRSSTSAAPASATVVEQRADCRAAAAGAPGHRSHRARRRGGRDRAAEQPELPGRRQHLRRRRIAVRRGVHPRRRGAQRSAEFRQPPAALSRRAAGIPRGHQRPLRAERHALGRLGERGDQVGHEPFTETRSSSFATSDSTRRARLRRSGPTASGSTTA